MKAHELMKETLRSVALFWLLENLEEAKFDPRTLQPGVTDQDLRSKIGYVSSKVRLLYLGKGSARMVFALDSKRALKMAMNAKGLAQNKAEIDISSNDSAVREIITRVFSHAPDDSWVISELVRPMASLQEFFNLTGCPFKLFKTVLAQTTTSGMESLRNNMDDPAWVADKIGQNHLNSLEDLDYYMEHSSLGKILNALDAAKTMFMTVDLTVLKHWGKTPDQRVVLLDYGYTEEVYSDYYKPSSQDPTATSSG